MENLQGSKLMLRLFRYFYRHSWTSCYPKYQFQILLYHSQTFFACFFFLQSAFLVKKDKWNKARRGHEREKWNSSGSGSLSNDDGDGDENGKNVVGLMSKTTLHVRHALLYISLLSLHDYNVEMPNFTFYGERKQATMNFSFSLLTNESSPQEINSREICLHFTFSVNWNKCDKVWKNMNSF